MKSITHPTLCAAFILSLTGMKATASPLSACDNITLQEEVTDSASIRKQSSSFETEYAIRQLPSNYIGISGGYAWLDNEVLTDEGNARTKPKGFDVNLEYSHLWTSKSLSRPIYYGIAVNGLVSLVDYKHIGNRNLSMQLTNCYVGCGGKIAYKTNQRFVWECLVTIGYAHTSDDMHINKAGGFAAYSEIGIGYMVDRHFCIGVSCADFTSTYSKPKGWPSDTRYGIDHWAVRARLGYFF